MVVRVHIYIYVGVIHRDNGQEYDNYYNRFEGCFWVTCNPNYRRV